MNLFIGYIILLTCAFALAASLFYGLSLIKLI
jgi:hypothetical protein